MFRNVDGTMWLERAEVSPSCRVRVLLALSGEVAVMLKATVEFGSFISSTSDVYNEFDIDIALPARKRSTSMPPRIPTIPRFLLPQRGSIWKTPSSIRNASNKSPKNKSSKPLVLEKPAKFNPPSHGAKQAKGPPRYLYSGPQLTAEELAAQKTKKYPNLMPAEGTFMHWFLHHKGIHLWITLVRLAPPPTE